MGKGIGVNSPAVGTKIVAQPITAMTRGKQNPNAESAGCSTTGATLMAEVINQTAKTVSSANLSIKSRPGTRTPKNAKMKVDPEDLLKAKGHKVTKSVIADEFMKTNDLTEMPMSY